MTMQVIKTVDLLEQQEAEEAFKVERARRAAEPQNRAACASAKQFLADGRRVLATINPTAVVRAQLDELEQRATAALEVRDGSAAREAAEKFKALCCREQLINPSPAQPAPVQPTSRPPAEEREAPAGAGGQQEAPVQESGVATLELRERVQQACANTKQTHLARFGKLQIELGYDVVPIVRDGKQPYLKGWQKIEATGALIDRWIAGMKHTGVGILAARTAGVDLDIRDADMAELMVEFVQTRLGCTPVRVGLPPKALLPYRCDKPFKKVNSKRFRTPDGLEHKVEILGDGQQWVASHVHPNTKKPYTWHYADGHTSEMLEIPRDELSEITEADAHAIVAEFEENARVMGWEEVGAGSPVESSAQDERTYSLDRAAALAGVNAETLEHLRSAALFSAEKGLLDGYNAWTSAGQALASLKGTPFEAEAQDIFMAASAKTATPDMDQAAEKWETYTGERTDFRHVFKAAQDKGWTNPKSKVADGTIDSLHLTTNQANAARLAKHHGADLAHMGGSWYGYNGTHWARSEAQATRFGMRLSRIIAGEVTELSEKARHAGDQAERERLHKLAEALAKFGARAENAAEIASALRLAAAELQCDPGEFDADPWLLNVQNGTLELRGSARLREHRRADRITRIAPVSYVPDAPRHRFEQFLAQVCHDPQTVAFLKRFLGYCLTGLTREQVMLILWGAGANGKSTLIKILRAVLGPYVQMAPPKLLEDARNDRHPTEIADLMGARLVCASETEEGARLREAFVKSITGSEPLKARVMYGDFFEFSPSHKLVLSTNHKPLIVGTDFAIWRRLMLVPFEVKFGSPEEVAACKCVAVKDPNLEAALLAEREGVLAWLVEGCVEWQRGGLRPPPAVLAATAAYRVDLDKLGAFLEERCTIDPAASTKANTLYASYMNWCSLSGYKAEAQRGFGLRLAERGLVREHRRDGWYWRGVALQPEDLSP